MRKSLLVAAAVGFLALPGTALAQNNAGAGAAAGATTGAVTGAILGGPVGAAAGAAIGAGAGAAAGAATEPRPGVVVTQPPVTERTTTCVEGARGTTCQETEIRR